MHDKARMIIINFHKDLDLSYLLLFPYALPSIVAKTWHEMGFWKGHDLERQKGHWSNSVAPTDSLTIKTDLDTKMIIISGLVQK